MHWHRTVASAAPLIPMPKPKMKMGSRMALEMTVNSVSPMASLGLPEDRTMELRPKYRCVTAFPSAMMVMYSRAKGRVASDAPKKRRIGSIHSRVTRVKATPVMMLRVMSLQRTFWATP